LKPDKFAVHDSISLSLSLSLFLWIQIIQKFRIKIKTDSVIESYRVKEGERK